MRKQLYRWCEAAPVRNVLAIELGFDVGGRKHRSFEATSSSHIHSSFWLLPSVLLVCLLSFSVTHVWAESGQARQTGQSVSELGC